MLKHTTLQQVNLNGKINMKQIKVAGQLYNFPDTMSENDIKKALDRHFSDVPPENNTGEGLSITDRIIYTGRVAAATDDDQIRKVFSSYYPGSTFERYVVLENPNIELDNTEEIKSRNQFGTRDSIPAKKTPNIYVSETEALNFYNKGWQAVNDFTVATRPDGTRNTLNRPGVTNHDAANVAAGAAVLAALRGAAVPILGRVAARSVPTSRVGDFLRNFGSASVTSAAQDLVATNDPQDINLLRAGTGGASAGVIGQIGRAVSGLGAGRLANNPLYDSNAELASQQLSRRLVDNPYSDNVTLFPVQMRNQGIELSDAERLGRGQLRLRITQQFEQQNQQVQKAAYRFLNDVGDEAPIVDSARALATAARKVLQQEKDALTRLGRETYTAVWEESRKNNVWADTKQVEQELSEFIQRNSGEPAEKAAAILKDLRSVNIKSSKFGSNVESLHNFITENLKIAVESSSGQSKALYSKIKGNLSDSLKKSSDSYLKATEKYSAAAEAFNARKDSIFGEVAGFTDDELPLMAQRVFYMKGGIPRSPQEIFSLRKEIMTHDPASWNKLVRYELQSRVNDFLKLNNAGSKFATNDPVAILKALRGTNKTEEAQIAAALGPVHYDNLVFISEILDVAGRARVTSGEALTKAMGESSRGGFTYQLSRLLNNADLTRLGPVANALSAGASDNLSMTLSQTRANRVVDMMFNPDATKMRTLAEQNKWKEAIYILSRLAGTSSSKYIQDDPQSEITE